MKKYIVVMSAFLAVSSMQPLSQATIDKINDSVQVVFNFWNNNNEQIYNIILKPIYKGDEKSTNELYDNFRLTHSLLWAESRELQKDKKMRKNQNQMTTYWKMFSVGLQNIQAMYDLVLPHMTAEVSDLLEEFQELQNYAERYSNQDTSNRNKKEQGPNGNELQDSMDWESY